MCYITSPFLQTTVTSVHILLMPYETMLSVTPEDLISHILKAGIQAMLYCLN
jgi:hypothetical protein